MDQVAIFVAFTTVERDPNHELREPAFGTMLTTMSISEKSHRVTLEIRGMHCAGCVGNVEGALQKVTGVSEAHVNLATEQAAVVCAPHTPIAALIAAVESAGFSAATPPPPESVQAARSDRGREEAATWRWRLLVAFGLLAAIIAAERIHHRSAMAAGWLQFVCAFAAQVLVGGPYLAGAWRQLRRGTTSMDTLIAIGTTAAFLAGVSDWRLGRMSMSFMDGAMILAFITLGKFLESRARASASQAIRKLLDLAPPMALVERAGHQVTVAVETILVGETLVVRPGDKIPLDAEISAGTSEIDESWLTGEPLPVSKAPGQRVFAGTINGSGGFTARVISTSRDTALAQVVELVQRAQESKADVQRLADHVVSWFVPMVLALAAVTFASWWVGGNASLGLSCAVAVLVTACPCALGLATPTAVIVGTGRGAELGILIKDAATLEAAGRIDTVVLDKTGTVTSGRPQVVAVVPRAEIASGELLRWAAAAEALSAHPLAKSVVQFAQAQGVAPPSAKSLEVVSGEGVTARCEQSDVLVGNEALLQRGGVELSKDILREVTRRRERGETALLVAVSGKMLGAIFVADVLAASSVAAIGELRKLGLRVVMLTGDKTPTARFVAHQAGITEVVAEVTPQQKTEHVASLQRDGAVVAMIGDGINDAPALAAADIGIAIGTGADVAIESADMVLRSHDLLGVPRAIRLARATMQTIRQNLWWAFSYNVLLLPFAAGLFIPLSGLRLPPTFAAAAMAASSVSVVANSLRLRWRRIDA